MEIRKKKRAGLAQEGKKTMLTQKMTLVALEMQWAFKTFSDLWNIALDNCNCVLTRGAYVILWDGAGNSLCTVLEDAGSCVTHFYTTVGFYDWDKVLACGAQK